MSDDTMASTAGEFHRPVLVEEVLGELDVEHRRAVVDGTVGGGGHARRILDSMPGDGRLLGIDRDPEAVEAASERLAPFGDRAEVVRGRYAEAPRLVERTDFGPPDGLLVDAGVSSHQLDTTERGFSHRQEGPLDMRMGPEATRVDELLDAVDAGRLAEILSEYGELGRAGRIAGAILEARDEGDLESTADLKRVVDGTGFDVRRGVAPSTLVFQALRIAVNDELGQLERAVEQLPDLLVPDGRAVFISYHSLEDRIVKRGLRRLASECECPPDLPVCACDARSEVEVLADGPIRPSDEEVERNPRARSARLRSARVL
ncbi:MAG: 16S rRNA (cytosine(1402)-N(4))-methyltransferase RsmH [Bradymonadaceae bacterium]